MSGERNRERVALVYAIAAFARELAKLLRSLFVPATARHFQT